MSDKAIRSACTPKTFCLGFISYLKVALRNTAYLAAGLGAIMGIPLMFLGGQIVVAHVLGTPLESGLVGYSKMGPVWSSISLLCLFWVLGWYRSEKYSLKRSFIGAGVWLVTVPVLAVADKYLGWAFDMLAANKGLFWHPALSVLDNLSLLPVELLIAVCLGAPLLFVGAFLYLGLTEGIKSICAKGQSQLSDDSLQSNG